MRGEALARYVREQTGGKLIEQLPLPLGIVATDLDNGQAVLFQRGDVGTAVRASSAVPAVFQPVKIGTREYVDGGLVSPVPVRFARQMGAELVIAVDISSAPDGNATGDPFKMLLQTFAIMGKSINAWELAKPIWWCGLRWVGCAAQTSRRAAARSRQGGWPCSRRCPAAARGHRGKVQIKKGPVLQPGLEGIPEPRGVERTRGDNLKNSRSTEQECLMDCG
jgi:predicted acylesterase/phospholipase RssA